MNRDTHKKTRRAWRLHLMSLRQHFEWVEAQKQDGYAAPVVRFSDRKVIDPGRPYSKEDGLTRH